MKEEPRYMQEQYENQNNQDRYQQYLEKRKEARQTHEKSLNYLKRTAMTGSSGRKQAGVEVLSGNKAAVLSDTRGDGARNNNRPSGVPTVNLEASKIGAPKAYEPEEDVKNDQTLFEWGIGADGEHGSER